MAYTIKYNDQEKGMIILWAGEVNSTEVIQSYVDRFSDPDITKQLRYILTDHTQVTRLDMDSEDIRFICKIVVEVSKQNDNIYMAGVEPTDLLRGMARMWQAYADDIKTGWHTITVRQREEAETWLQENLGTTLNFDRTNAIIHAKSQPRS